jgi:hypothetical protein
MSGYQMSIRLSDQAVQALDNPRGRFRDCQGTDTGLEEALSSEVSALLESLGLPLDGIRVHCWLDPDECVATAPDVVL